jgi:peptidoglycan L-alanyl-D-glutamate endopeptidase CwlK
MASREVALPHPLMIPLVEKWKATCPVETLIYCTVREAWEQAVLFATGRTEAEIAAGVARLRSLGLTQHEMILEKQKPKPGKRVTNAPPGLSFHQPHWVDGQMGALAFDFVPFVGGKPLWNDRAAYEAAGAAAEAVGLTWSGRWKRFRETAHVQMDRQGALKIVPLARGEYK